MPDLYSCLLVTEPDYGDRVVRIHCGTANHHIGVDLLTGEDIRMPIIYRWNGDAERSQLICEDGWQARQINLRHAESLVGLPTHSLPTVNDGNHADLWADKRLRDPVFIAVTEAILAHPEVLYYHVEWRDWVHARSPKTNATPQRRTIYRDRTRLYSSGGDGTIERYAQALRGWLTPSSPAAVAHTPAPYQHASQAVIADLSKQYDRELESERTGWATRHQPREPVRTFEEILDICQITPTFLEEIDARHRAADTELAPIRARFAPQPPALALF